MSKKLTKAPPKAGVKTKTDFQAKFSRRFVIPNKIRAALAELGPDGYEEQGDFIKRVGVTPVDLNTYRPEFEEQVIEARAIGSNSKVSTIWCGSKKLAKELQEYLA